MAGRGAGARLAVDIGGTFTDVALEHAGRTVTTKALTTPRAPEEGVMTGIGRVLEEAGLAPADIGLVIHGTTLATNALIERKGARTALVVTEGFRDSVEMAYENRFEQYDVNVDRPKPLVPRHLRLPVRERVTAAGDVLVPLHEDSVRALVPTLRAEGVESIAIGLIHAYAAPAHEERVAEILAEALPDVAISLSSAVCPEIREYERQSTTCANAYVQPLMARYLHRLEAELAAQGFDCPFFLMTSGGGLTTLDTAARFPIRLVESGPAGGAILASRLAAEMGLPEVLSFDMGGTTAKICLVDDGAPLKSRTFEVDRVYRFKRGSGLPVRIPVIEMVEIGAGGGSIASVDALNRIAVGPESAGSEPGPACYGRGGERPTVTDADLAMGRIDPEGFAGGAVTLDAEAAARALADHVGGPLALEPALAAFGVCEIVDENMANAARVHAIEWGKDVARRTMIAFGGAAPLHAARLAEKLGCEAVVVPTGAGVGSAIGFLQAPIAYEVVRSRFMRLSAFDAGLADEIVSGMQAEAAEVVRRGAPEAALVETRQAFMRYAGQGHEISVALPVRALTPEDRATLHAAFEAAYVALYGRTIPNLDVEILSWTLTVETAQAPPSPAGAPPAAAAAPEPIGRRAVFDPGLGRAIEAALHDRAALAPGMRVPGPALIAEAQTTTVVSPAFDATVSAAGHIVLTRKGSFA
ncbi:hydantoinase/oxoprolinase family protein [Salinarimonas sp.]|uniref:hydantoinase/oxoprolinase family protein n=1 Tax=Salinarimonas sp. TaxID=2766526 RepID=UPI0032D8C9BE